MFAPVVCSGNNTFIGSKQPFYCKLAWGSSCSYLVKDSSRRGFDKIGLFQCNRVHEGLYGVLVLQF